jgi:Holliday junction resolvase RusA-like endonuclease
MQHTIVLTGKIKPYVRMTRAGKYVKLDALEYRASQAELAWQIRQQMGESGMLELPGQTPLRARMKIQTVSLHTCDLDNQLKAILDAGNKILYPDDRWIDHVVVERSKGTADITVFTVGTLERA